jgi:hypothetical protein
MNPFEDRRKHHCRKAIEHLRRAIEHAQKAEKRETFFPDMLKQAVDDLFTLKEEVATVLVEGASKKGVSTEIDDHLKDVA